MMISSHLTIVIVFMPESNAVVVVVRISYRFMPASSRVRIARPLTHFNLTSSAVPVFRQCNAMAAGRLDWLRPGLNHTSPKGRRRGADHRSPHRSQDSRCACVDSFSFGHRRSSLRQMFEPVI